MPSAKSKLNNFKKHLTISLSINHPLATYPHTDTSPQHHPEIHSAGTHASEIDSAGTHVSEIHSAGTHVSEIHSAGTRGKAVIEISSSWMAASFENALKTVKDSSVVVSGFRPGKVPAQLLRKKKTPKAIDTMLNWILQDLGEVLDSYDSFQILTPGNFSFTPSWKEGEPFTVEATFEYWPFPDISVDDICEFVGREASKQGLMVDDSPEMLEWLGDALGQLFLPHLSAEVQQIIVQYYLDQAGGKLTNEEREAVLAAVCRHLGAAFLFKRFGFETSEDDIEKEIGLVAAEMGTSYYDLYDELIAEGGFETYRQHLQMMAALSAIARRVSLLQSNEKTAPPVADRELTTP